MTVEIEGPPDVQMLWLVKCEPRNVFGIMKG